MGDSFLKSLYHNIMYVVSPNIPSLIGNQGMTGVGVNIFIHMEWQDLCIADHCLSECDHREVVRGESFIK